MEGFELRSQEEKVESEYRVEFEDERNGDTFVVTVGEVEMRSSRIELYGLNPKDVPEEYRLSNVDWMWMSESRMLCIQHESSVRVINIEPIYEEATEKVKA